jgi:hemolysin III
MELRDPVSSASHLLTAVWAAYATLILIRLTPGTSTRRLAVAVFGVSMVLLYLASGTFHAVPYTRTSNPDAFRFFQKIDQSAIFLLIAGTNTPCMVIVLGGKRGLWYLRAMWAWAAAGIACLWLLPKAPHAAVVGIYMGMGWFGMLPGLYYYRALGGRPLLWVLLGAAFYTAGAVCELLEWPVISVWPVRFAYHEILHLCDTAGSLAFFVFITRHVIPYQPPVEGPDPDAEPDVDTEPELAVV